MNDHPKKKRGTIFYRSASQKLAAAVPLAWRQLVVKPMIVEPLPATPAVRSGRSVCTLVGRDMSRCRNQLVTLQPHK